MKPGSTDGILTVLASLLVTAVLFIAQHFTSAPHTNRQSLPEDNLAEGATSAQSDSAWRGQQKETRTASTSNSSWPSDSLDAPFGGSASGSSNGRRGNTAAPSRLPSIPSSTGRTSTTSSRKTTGGQTRTFGPSTTSTNGSQFGSANTDRRSQATNQQPANETAGTFKVVSIIDGDTVDLLVNRQPLRLRLNGIDTPEKGQPFGNAAKDALAKAIGGQSVQYVVRDTDRYNRSIADVYFRGVHINKWLIQKGLAWHYKAYNNDSELAQAEQEASAASRGLWADPRRVAPWNWRKLSKLERDQYR